MYRLIPFLAIAALGCSGSAKPGAETPSEVPDTKSQPVDQTPPDSQTADIAWADMNPEQRGEHMKVNVKPKMATLFQAFDGERYAEFGCKTCHGEDAEANQFAMPNPDLPKLDNFEELKQKQPKMMEFMMTQVVPNMASLVDQEPYNPETQTGFGCGGCHPSG